MRLWIPALLMVAACTKSNPDYCKSDADCATANRPFCDIKGEYEESDYTANTCSATPAACPVERCGCEPGMGFTCDGDDLTVCGEDGHSTTKVTCSLGCSASERRCLTFTPSNDLAGAFAAAAGQPDVTLPPGARIDTTLGTVQDANGTPVTVQTMMISQNGGASKIRALIAKSFIVDNTTVTGTAALALVAADTITVRGIVDASANAVVAGPGAQESPAVCVGTTTSEVCSTFCTWAGGGGGGNAKAGGNGGGGASPGVAGGALIPGFNPLIGGCRGGGLMGTDPQQGGGGGGAVQLVALNAVTFTGTGFIDVGGGGGMKSSGGGSGELVIIEAARVRVDGMTTGVTANGGSGGACDMTGTDAGRTTAAVTGPSCTYYGGSGGTGTVDPQASPYCTGTCALGTHYGGGGGSAGRLRVVTRVGSYTRANAPIVSAVESSGTLEPH